MKRTFLLTGATFLLCLSLTVHAQENASDENTTTTQTARSYMEEGQEEWEFMTSLTYETGDYGTSETTNTVYWPFTLKRYWERADASFTIPLLYQETGPGVTAIGGRAFQTSRFTFGSEATDSGIGDMLLKGRYYLFDETSQDFNLAAAGKIKFPTADDEEGLGTGEFDEGFGLEAGKTLNAFWSLYADIYYTFIGEPPGTDLDNEVAFNVGAGYNLTDETSASLFYQERTALVDGRDNPRDIFLALNHELNNTTDVFGGVSFGVSDGSPDFGVTAGTKYRF